MIDSNMKTEKRLISVDMNDICRAPWKYAVEPFHIMDRLYFVGNSWVGVYLIDTGDGLLLIDTAMAQNVYLTLEGIRKLGFDPRDIKWILLSHAHFDHCGGAAMISHYADAEIWMGQEDMFFLEGRQDLILPAEGGFFQPFTVSRHYEDGKEMQFGSFKITAVHCPGHTPGTYSFFFDLEEDGLKYRAAMHGGLGVNTVTTKYLTEHELPISLQEEFVKNLVKMRDEKVDVPIGSHTNHGAMLQKAERARKGENPNPFIDPEGFRKMIDARLQDLAEVESFPG